MWLLSLPGSVRSPGLAVSVIERAITGSQLLPEFSFTVGGLALLLRSQRKWLIFEPQLIVAVELKMCLFARRTCLELCPGKCFPGCLSAVRHLSLNSHCTYCDSVDPRDENRPLGQQPHVSKGVFSCLLPDTPDLEGVCRRSGCVLSRITACFVQPSSVQLPSCPIQGILPLPTGTGWSP